MFLDYGVRIKGRSPGTLTLLVQLCGQNTGYLPTDKAVQGGTTAPTNSSSGPTAARSWSTKRSASSSRCGRNRGCSGQTGPPRQKARGLRGCRGFSVKLTADVIFVSVQSQARFAGFDRRGPTRTPPVEREESDR